MTTQIDDKSLQTIGNNAVRKAQKQSLANGIPNVYSKNGTIYFQLVDGTITMTNPYKSGVLKEKLDKLTNKSETK